VQVPRALGVTVVPAIAQIDGVVETRVTASPELALALRLCPLEVSNKSAG